MSKPMATRTDSAQDGGIKPNDSAAFPAIIWIGGALTAILVIIALLGRMA